MEEKCPFDIRKYIEVFDTLGDPVSIQDRDYKILYQNAAHGRLVGRHLGEYCYRAYEQKSERCGGCPLALTFEDGGFHKAERSTSVGCRLVHVEIVTSPIRDAKGNIVAGLEAARDISARKELEEKVIDAKLEWEKTFDSINDIVTIQDRQMRIVRANKAAVKQSGGAFESVLGRLCYEVFRGASKPCDGCPVVSTLHDSTPHTAEIEHKKKTFLVSAFPIMENGEPCTKVVRIARDITEKKNLADQLIQAQKMEAIGTLAGGIAHDFNNALTAILGYGEMVQEALDPGSQTWDDQAEVIKAGNRAKDLVRQILSFSRRTSHEMVPLQPHLLVKEALKLLRATIPTTIEIKADIDPECGLILADPTRIHQVLMNICINAFHAMRDKGGVLTVSLTETRIEPEDYLVHLGLKPGEYLKLDVSDTGHGMKREVMEKIFEPYYTTKKKDEGTGLGLSMVHGIVKDHGGHITVYSEPGAGTTFHVYLPCIARETATEAVVIVPPVPGGTERLMVVDDEPEIAGLLARRLGNLGYPVDTYSDSLVALQAFKGQAAAFDLVITDKSMPGLDGLQLTAELHAVRPELPVILTTGFNESILDAKLKKIGIREVLIKPISKRKVAEVIRKVLDERK